VRRGSYRPQPGDLVFFTDTANGEATRVGIVKRADSNEFTAIEGDRGSAVSTMDYSLGDPAIIGFMRMEAVMESYDPQYVPPTPAPTATPEPTAEPTATPEPMVEPTAEPTATVEPIMTIEPTAEPTATPEPTVEPAVMPEVQVSDPAELMMLTVEPEEIHEEPLILLETMGTETVSKVPAGQNVEPVAEITVELGTQEGEPSKEGQQEEDLILVEEIEAIIIEDGAEEEPEEQLPLIQTEELPESVRLEASMPGRDYKVVVRYDTDSGIPQDAQLIVSEILDQERYDRYLENAQNMLDEEEREELEDFYLLSVSLISNGVDYASMGGYEVEIVMNDAIEAEGMQAISFTDDLPTRLQTNAVINADETIDRISFNSH
jgi:hypothetical protein